MHILRNFSYLDTSMLNDYLAAVEGALPNDEKVVETRESGGTIGGEGGLPSLLRASGKHESKDKTEVTRQSLLTDAAKFQRLYSFLERERAFGYHETMSEDIWGGIRRNDLIEVTGTISMGKMNSMGDVVKEFANVFQLMEGLPGAPILKDDDRQIIEMMKVVSQMSSVAGIPVVLSLSEAPDYRVIMHLTPEFLMVPKTRLFGEVSVFGKVQRKLSPGERINLFKPLPTLEHLSATLGSTPNLEMPPEISDMIEAPAVVVLPLALYR